MDYKICPSKLNGEVFIPSSKSLSHRAIICASLCAEKSSLIINGISEDILTTLNAIKSLGGNYKIKNNLVTVSPIKCKKNYVPKINCNESASTLRFLLPLCATLYEKVDFTGKKSLCNRPVIQLLKSMKGVLYNNKKLPLSICNNLKGNDFEIDGTLSSEYVSGMLFALSNLNKKSTLKVNGNINNPYIKMTIKVLKDFGVNITKKDNTFTVFGKTFTKKENYNIEGDYSNASPFIISNKLGAKIKINNLNDKSIQGDKNVYSLLEKIDKDEVIDLSSNPDLFMCLSVYASLKNKKTKFIGIQRLKYKESDRIKSVYHTLKKVGVKCKKDKNSFTILRRKNIKHNKILSSFNDHRICMAQTILGLFLNKSITIKNASAINKSYPNFFNDIKSLGGNIYEL
ncbi:MAG: hypothetical protein MJ066_00550 [Clostridia bacterium]|nr:hypothetical protein [Clostridia bacterium]